MTPRQSGAAGEDERSARPGAAERSTYKQSGGKRLNCSPHRRSDRSVDRRECRTQLIDEPGSRPCDLCSSLVSVEEQDPAELGFDARDCPADRPVCASQALSRQGVAAGLCDRHNSLKVGQR